MKDLDVVGMKDLDSWQASEVRTLSINRESRKSKLNERSDGLEPAFRNAL
jgi:hypothetical protein